VSSRTANGTSIDLNVDAGESFGRWRVADEAKVYPYVSSVNLACGFHAGDPANLMDSITLALEHGLALGAHPGYPDKVGFGRRDMQLDERELLADTIYQLGALTSLVRAASLVRVTRLMRAGADADAMRVGADADERNQVAAQSAVDADTPTLNHVKAHGALYQRMMVDPDVAGTFARAVALFDARLPVFVLAGAGGAVMRAAAATVGVKTVEEAFPDRAYLRDGSLAPRRMSGSVLTEPGLIAERAVAMASGVPFAALDGGETRVEADTLCLHGDGVSAHEAARAVHGALTGIGIVVRVP